MNNTPSNRDRNDAEGNESDVTDSASDCSVSSKTAYLTPLKTPQRRTLRERPPTPIKPISAKKHGRGKPGDPSTSPKRRKKSDLQGPLIRPSNADVMKYTQHNIPMDTQSSCSDTSSISSTTISESSHYEGEKPKKGEKPSANSEYICGAPNALQILVTVHPASL